MYKSDYDSRYPLNGGHHARSGSPIEIPLNYWVIALFPYVKNAGVFECPSDASPMAVTVEGQRVSFSYGYNAAFPGDGYSSFNAEWLDISTTPWTWKVTKDSQVEEPARTWMLADCYQPSVFTLTYLRATVGGNQWYSTPSTPVHNGGLNFVFADGHAKWLQGGMFVYSYNAPQCRWSAY